MQHHGLGAEGFSCWGGVRTVDAVGEGDARLCVGSFTECRESGDGLWVWGLRFMVVGLHIMHTMSRHCMFVVSSGCVRVGAKVCSQDGSCMVGNGPGISIELNDLVAFSDVLLFFLVVVWHVGVAVALCRLVVVVVPG